MKYLASIFVLLFLGISVAKAQGSGTKPPKTATVSIHTSANCGECKERLEGALHKVKGVKSSNLDLETKTIAVVYAPKKTNPGAIRTAISKTGYDADEVVANQEAHDNLPQCCRKGGHD